MTRRFVVIGHTQRLDPRALADPAGTGRWDVLARCVASAFLLSNGIRSDTEAFLLLRGAEPELTIRMRGSELRNLNPDERSIVGLLLRCREARPVGEHPEPAGPGMSVARWGLEALLRRLAQDGPIVWMTESGDPGPGPADADAAYVLSDHLEFTPQESAALERLAPRRWSLGAKSLHAASCITIVHHVLDGAEAPPPAGGPAGATKRDRAGARLPPP